MQRCWLSLYYSKCDIVPCIKDWHSILSLQRKFIVVKIEAKSSHINAFKTRIEVHYICHYIFSKIVCNLIRIYLSDWGTRYWKFMVTTRSSISFDPLYSTLLVWNGQRLLKKLSGKNNNVFDTWEHFWVDLKQKDFFHHRPPEGTANFFFKIGILSKNV